MFQSVKISPSILSANFLDLGADIALIKEAGAGYVHVDVMDGHFVPNLTMGVPLVKQLAKNGQLPLDVHLMISNPLTQMDWFLKAGAHILTAHVEAFASPDEINDFVERVHGSDAKACLSVKPHTPVETVFPYLDRLDMVLVMSVEPGFSGQSYIEGTEDKIALLVAEARSRGFSPLIEVDGGIGPVTVERVCRAGADVLVCGNAVFAQENPANALREIEALGNKARCAGLGEVCHG